MEKTNGKEQKKSVGHSLMLTHIGGPDDMGKQNTCIFQTWRHIINSQIQGKVREAHVEKALSITL